MTVLLYCPAATSVKYCKYPSIAEQKLPTKFTQNFPSKNTRTGISLFFLFLSLFFFLTISSFIGIVFFLPFFFLLHYQTGPALFTPSPTHLLSLSYSLPHVSLFSCLSLLFSLLHSLYLYYRSTQLSLSLSSSSSSRSIPTDWHDPTAAIHALKVCRCRFPSLSLPLPLLFSLVLPVCEFLFLYLFHYTHFITIIALSGFIWSSGVCHFPLLCSVSVPHTRFPLFDTFLFSAFLFSNNPVLFVFVYSFSVCLIFPLAWLCCVSLHPSPFHTTILPPAHTLLSTTTPPLLSLSHSLSLFSSPQLQPILLHLSSISLPSTFPSLLFSLFSCFLFISFSVFSSLFLFVKIFPFYFWSTPPLSLPSPLLSSLRDTLHAAINQGQKYHQDQLVNRSFKKGRAMISLRVEQHSDFSRFRQYHCPSSRGNDDSTAFHGNADCQWEHHRQLRYYHHDHIFRSGHRT